MKGFMMSLTIAEKFFKRCAEREAVTLKERLKIMDELLHEENIKIVKENQMQALMKDKKVLLVHPKKKNKNV